MITNGLSMTSLDNIINYWTWHSSKVVPRSLLAVLSFYWISKFCAARNEKSATLSRPKIIAVPVALVYNEPSSILPENQLQIR